MLRPLLATPSIGERSTQVLQCYASAVYLFMLLHVNHPKRYRKLEHVLNPPKNVTSGGWGGIRCTDEARLARGRDAALTHALNPKP